MKLLVLCLQSEGKRFSAGICRITFLGGPQLDRADRDAEPGRIASGGNDGWPDLERSATA